ncbi:DExH-box ATP-dependent RNA helicase DExH15 chloroplastic, partial [Sarracenia purpurea var. burkii]
MNTLPIFPLAQICAFPPSKTLSFFHPETPVQPTGLGFCCLKSLHRSTPNHSPQFPTSYKFPRSLFPSESQLSDADEEDEEDEDDDDDEEAADEYEDISGEVSDSAEQRDDEFESSVDDALEAKSRFEEFKWQRVERLRSEVREFGEEIIDVDELASIYDFRIDKFQRLAVQAFLRGSSVIVSAPTSSGKTLIAEAAAVATVARGKRIFYTTPLKALSNQKFREFRETFGDSLVGLLTGDSAINKDAQVIYCPKEVQIICLSATVANPDELAGWIGQIHGKTELVVSSKRPVPLTWHFSTKTSLLPLLDENGTSMNRKLSLNHLQLYSSGIRSEKDEGSRRRFSKNRETNTSYNANASMNGRSLSKNDINTIRRSQVPQVTDILRHLHSRDMLPAIWFIFSRKGCDASVQYLENCKLLDECEISEVELALKRFRIQYPDAVRESSVKGLLRGVAAHHAGCLPLWKSFVEELFQRGLVKVVFATETLAAGINMPARTAVIASLSKRSESGRVQLSSNELLQMAGRAGRRGIDERGHVVLVQTPYEGAEECSKLLFSGLEPLVSQFTASYGMVLNLLAGGKITRRSNESDDMKASRAGRTLEEARKLVEQSFGNYVGSNVMLSAKEELSKIQNEIEMLTSEVSDEAIDRKTRKLLPDRAYKEIADLQEELRVEKRVRSELRRRMEIERMSALRPLLEELEGGDLPFMSLQYNDAEGVQHLVSAVYLGKVDSVDGSKLGNMVYANDSFALHVEPELYIGGSEKQHNANVFYYVALGSDNSWYLFTEKWIKTMYKTGFPNVALAHGDALPREIMRMLLDKEEMQWQKLVDSELGGLWSMDGSLETWSWSLNVPVLNSLSEDDEVLRFSQAYHTAVECYREQRNKVSRLKKKISRTEGFKGYKKIVDVAKYTEEKIRRLKARSRRLINRIEQIEPSGWKEFVKVSNAIHEARALDINTQMIFPLGETAATIRGENELWLAMVLRNKILLDLKPPQLAALCGSLVSEGIKIPCCLDGQFSGMVEAWASGLTWREIMMECAMDEGDLARLLRRTIDLLAQVWL